MYSGPCLRLRVTPTPWNHSYEYDYDPRADEGKGRYKINCDGAGISNDSLTIHGSKYGGKHVSTFSCEVSFHPGGSLAIPDDEHRPPQRVIDPAVLQDGITPHSGWISHLEDDNHKRDALAVDLHVDDDLFRDVYDRLKLGLALPEQFWVVGAAKTLTTRMGPFAEWDITGKNYLYIIDYNVFFPAREVRPAR